MEDYFWEHNLRDYALFVFGIHMGRRISDLLALNVRDVAYIDDKSRLRIQDDMIIQERKTGKFAKLPIAEHARWALKTYLDERLESAPSMGAVLNEPLFKSRRSRKNGWEYRVTRQHVWRVLSNAARACGLNYKVGTHSLRKTYGYHHFIDDGGIDGLLLLQQAFNHSAPNITLDYIGITQDDLYYRMKHVKFGAEKKRKNRQKGNPP